MSDSDDPSDGEELATVIPLGGAESSSGTQDPIVGPTGAAPETGQLVAVPRLARHEVVLDDDHRVGVAVCGQGVPVVLVHGFTAEGILYAQTLSRLVRMGFKVIAVDVAGHGGTQGLPTGGEKLESYTRLLAPRQAVKLGRLVAPTLMGHARRPWRLLGPAISMLRSQGSQEMLEKLAEDRIPVVVIHGDRDIAVPYRTAVDAARRSGGTLVTIHGGTHSGVLKDPETLPAVLAQLLDGPLAPGRAPGLG